MPARLALALSFLLALAGPALAQGTFEVRTLEGRRCKLYSPSSRPQGAPLLVLLHGCTQDADVFARSTRMNAIAEQRGFYVLYPEQPSSANQNKCWNWFLPEHQERGRGEPANLAAITERVIVDLGCDRDRVHVAGLSAGAAMSVILGATYPDLFAAIGVCAGLEYKAASAVGSAYSAMSSGGPSPDGQGLAALRAMGTRARPLPVLVVQGAADRTVAPKNGEQVIAQWAQTADLALDGQDDEDVTAHADRRTASTSPGGLAYRLEDVLDAAGVPFLRLVAVERMGHAWSGGDVSGSYVEPAGPDASTLLVEFFAQHPRSYVFAPAAATPVTPPPPVVTPPTPVTPTPTPTPNPTPPCSCGVPDSLTLRSKAAEDGTIGKFVAHGQSVANPKAGDRGMFGGETDRALLSFDQATLPAGARIVGARLRVCRAALKGEVDGLQVDVAPGALGATGAIERADYAAAARHTGVALLPVPDADGAWSEVDLPLEVARLAAQGRLQVRLRALTPTGFEANSLELVGGEDPVRGATLVLKLSQ